MSIILDGFNSRKLLFINLIYELSRTPSFVGDFLNFLVKEGLFSTLDYLLELLPVLDVLSQPIFLEVLSTIFVLPTLGVLGDIDDLEISSHILFIEWVRVRTIFSSNSTSNRLLALIELIVLMILLTKVFSLSLSLTIIHFLVWKCSLMIGMVIIRGVWSDVRCYSG